MIAPEDLAGDRRQPKGLLEHSRRWFSGELSGALTIVPTAATWSYSQRIQLVITSNTITASNWMAPNRIFLPLE
jgi:hypothetical protein